MNPEANTRRNFSWLGVDNSWIVVGDQMQYRFVHADRPCRPGSARREVRHGCRAVIDELKTGPWLE